MAREERKEENGTGEMSVSEAGHRGGEATKRKHGHETLEEHRRERAESREE